MSQHGSHKVLLGVRQQSLIGWDVFGWMGHRRFARHWSVPQSRDELADTYQIPLSADAVEDALRRDQTMLAARQQAPQVLAAAYRTVEALVLSIDGLPARERP